MAADSQRKTHWHLVCRWIDEIRHANWAFEWSLQVLTHLPEGLREMVAAEVQVLHRYIQSLVSYAAPCCATRHATFRLHFLWDQVNTFAAYTFSGTE